MKKHIIVKSLSESSPGLPANGPIKVLHIIQGLHFGGAEQVVLTLARSFDRNFVVPIVVCLSEGVLLEKLINAGVQSYLVPMHSKTDVLKPLLRTIKIIRKQKIDLLHTHTVRSNLIGRLATLFTNKKCVTHLHSPILRDFADLRRCRFNERLDSLTRPCVNKFIAVSHSLKQEMVSKGMTSSRICVIHNGLDFNSLHQKMLPLNSKNTIRSQYGIAPDAFLIVLVALLRPRKGLHVGIETMKEVNRFFPKTYLLVVGDDHMSEEPGYGNRMRQLAEEYGIGNKVIFTGFRQDIPAILSQCDLMMLPSLFGEGLPMVILESMAMGIPVVASCVEGVPEVINDGIDGFLVPPGNVAALTQAILRILQNPECLRYMKKKSQIKIRKKFDSRLQAVRMTNLYRQVLGV